jgi:hypothetical protein
MQKCYHSGYKKIKANCKLISICTATDCKKESDTNKFVCCSKCFTEYCSKECRDVDKQNHISHCEAWKREGNNWLCSICNAKQ